MSKPIDWNRRRVGRGASLVFTLWLLATPANAGGLDPTFGAGGAARQAVGYGVNPASHGAVQADGKLLIVGAWGFECSILSDEREPVVARYEPDGSLDSSFGIGGISRVDLSLPDADAYAIAEADDGKVVLAGQVSWGAVNDLLVARLSPDGALDTTFGGGAGYVTFDAAGAEVAFAVVPHPDGRISVVGEYWVSGYNDVLVVRFAADGSLDTTFGSGTGYVISHFNVAVERAFDAVLQPDGKLVVVGVSDLDAFVARYTEDGSLDTGFGSGGVAVTHFGSMDFAWGVALQDDGKILVSGEAYFSGVGSDGIVARYTEGGLLDTGFGSGGIVGFRHSTSDRALAVDVQQDGRIVSAIGLAVSGWREIMGAVRLEANGAVDTSFGSGGLVIPSVLEHESTPWSIAALDDGGIVLMGLGDTENYKAFVAARLDASGAADLTFGDQGVATTRVRGTLDYGLDVLGLPDGRILSGVNSHAPESCETVAHQPKMGVVAHLPDGSLDPAFGAGGIANLLANNSRSQVSAMAVQPDGKLILAGSGSITSYEDFMAVRLMPDGVPDPSFGTDGFAYVQIPLQDERAFGVALQPDGKIVLAGSVYGTTQKDVQVARLDASGALDPSFGTGGVVVSNIANQDDFAYDLALQTDGKLVVGGRTNQSFLLLRYNGDGSLDGTFGSGGTVTPSLPFDANALSTVLVDIDGNVVVVGDADDPGFAGRRGVILRRGPDGSPDLGFGASGTLAPEAWIGLSLRDAVILPNHRILVAGNQIVDGDLALVSVMHEGYPDLSHAPNGVEFFDLGAWEHAEAIAMLDAGDRVVVAGTIQDGAGADLLVAVAPSPVPEPGGAASLLAGCALLLALSRAEKWRPRHSG